MICRNISLVSSSLKQSKAEVKYCQYYTVEELTVNLVSNVLNHFCKRLGLVCLEHDQVDKLIEDILHIGLEIPS